MDIEFQRMKERLETIHLILDDMQVRTFNLTNKFCYHKSNKSDKVDINQ